MKKKPDYKIVLVKNDPLFGSYYKIQYLGAFGLLYHNYWYKKIFNNSYEGKDFRFHSYEDAKKELDNLLEGMSQYNWCEKTVLGVYKKDKVE